MRRRPPLPPRPNPPGQPRLTSMTRPGSSNFPVSIIPWTLVMARRKAAKRASEHDRFATITLAFVLSAMFVVNLSVTAIAVAVPRIADDFSVSQSTIVWAVTGPILVAAVLGPTFGKLGDQYGHRLLLLLGLLVNAIFTIMIATSFNAGSFVVFRLMAAVGGAAIAPSALAFVNRLFAPDDRATALGWWSAVSAGSPVIGVVIGGPLIDGIGWRWLFIAQAPLVLAAGVAMAIFLPETTKKEKTPFDVAGAVTLGIGIGALLLVVTGLADHGFDGFVLGLSVVAVVALATFVIVERRAETPLIPPSYWTMPGFVIPTLTMSLCFAAYMGGFVLTPLMLQETVFGYTASETGRIIIARPLAFAVFGPITGILVRRVADRSLAVGGALLLVVSMVIYTVFEPSHSIWLLILALALAGAGMGLAAPIMTATVANSVSDEDLGVAGAAQQMLQQVGLVIGIQILQATQASRADGGIVGSYHTAFAVATVLSMAGAVVAFFLPARKQLDSVPKAASA